MEADETADAGPRQSRSCRCRRLLAAVTVVAVAAWVGTPVAATAAVVGCDVPIYNQGGLLDERTSDLAAAAQKLQSIGVEVRAFDLQWFDPYPSLEAYVNARQKACRSWQSPTGAWKPDLLVIAASIKGRKIGIFYRPGSELAAAFRKAGGTRRVVVQFIYPELYQARWPAGFIAGMHEAYRVVDSYRHR